MKPVLTCKITFLIKLFLFTLLFFHLNAPVARAGHFDCPHCSGINIMVLEGSVIDSKGLNVQRGDELAAFSNGIVAGVAVVGDPDVPDFSKWEFSLTVYGNNPAIDDVSGPENGDPLNFKIYSASADKEFAVMPIDENHIPVEVNYASSGFLVQPRNINFRFSQGLSPVIASISPCAFNAAELQSSGTNRAVIKGERFSPGVSVYIGLVEVSIVELRIPSEIVIELPSDLGMDTYDVAVRNSDDEQALLEEGLTIAQQVENRPPVISPLVAGQSLVDPGQTVEFNCTALDPDEDELIFSWSASAGEMTSDGTGNGQWIAPDTPGLYFITCQVSDQELEVSTSMVVRVVEPSQQDNVNESFRLSHNSVRFTMEGESGENYPVNVEIYGGVPPYQYNFNDPADLNTIDIKIIEDTVTLTPLAAGEGDVTIQDSNNNSASIYFQITESVQQDDDVHLSSSEMEVVIEPDVEPKAMFVTISGGIKPYFAAADYPSRVALNITGNILSITPLARGDVQIIVSDDLGSNATINVKVVLKDTQDPEEKPDEGNNDNSNDENNSLTDLINALEPFFKGKPHHTVEDGVVYDLKDNQKMAVRLLEKNSSPPLENMIVKDGYINIAYSDYGISVAPLFMNMDEFSNLFSGLVEQHAYGDPMGKFMILIPPVR